MNVKLEGVELRRISMPLVSPFRTSFGTQTVRDILLLRAVTSDGEGWGECVAMSDPLYSSEYVDATADVLRRFLLPELAASADELDRHGAHAVGSVLHKFKGHRMAKAALEMAVLDAELRAADRSWARELGSMATCTVRAPPALVIWPKLVLPKLVLGTPHCGLFVTL